MFTGIVEEIGYIKSFSRLSKGAELIVSCSKILEDAKIGDSICVNGVCQTITSFDKSSFTVMLSEETLNISNFSVAVKNNALNLERALTLNSRLGGHIVTGHVDCLGEIIAINQLSDFYDIELEIPEASIKYLVFKGSVTVNGISLTVANINNNRIKIAIIPQTFQNTMLKTLKIGDIVNIETDILAKYIEKLLQFKDNKKNNNNIDMKFLKDNGFV